ncbi:MAG: DUF167 domain-containing protein [Pseudomonadales bacterium]|nr:DUF167 domain-containing protein [Pseudomonadales bacterium]
MKTLQVKVKPNSSSSELLQLEDGTWLAWLKSAPIDGKANAELVRLIAKTHGCPQSAVSIHRGASGRMKLVRIECSR